MTAGHAVHLQANAEPVVVRAGDVVHIPAGEWHGLANPFSEPVTITSIYGGVSDRAEAGYELHPGPPFDFSNYHQ